MTKRMETQQLEAIRVREAQLIPEKWYFDGSDICESKNGNPVITANNYGDMMISEVVGKFIAHSREDVPALLAEVEQLRKERYEKEAQFDTASLQIRRYSDALIRSAAENERLREVLNDIDGELLEALSSTYYGYHILQARAKIREESH